MISLVVIVAGIVIVLVLIGVLTEFRVRKSRGVGRDKMFRAECIGHIPPAWEDPRTKMFKTYRNFIWRGPWIKVGNLRADIRKDVTTYRAKPYPDRVQWTIRIYWDRRNTHDQDYKQREV